MVGPIEAIGEAPPDQAVGYLGSFRGALPMLPVTLSRTLECGEEKSTLTAWPRQSRSGSAEAARSGLPKMTRARVRADRTGFQVRMRAPCRSGHATCTLHVSVRPKQSKCTPTLEPALPIQVKRHKSALQHGASSPDLRGGRPLNMGLAHPVARLSCSTFLGGGGDRTAYAYESCNQLTRTGDGVPIVRYSIS